MHSPFYYNRNGRNSSNITKTNGGRNFQHTKFSVIDLVLTNRRQLSGTSLKSACGKSSFRRVSFTAGGNAITKATEFVTFSFFFAYFGFLPLLRVWPSLSVSDTDFFQRFDSHNPKKFRLTTLDWEWWRFCPSLINLTDWRERRATCQQLIGDIKHTWENTFFTCVVTAFPRAGNPCITP